MAFATTMKTAGKGILLAKIEATYGTDPTPSNTVDAIYADSIDIKPIWDSIERANLAPALGANPKYYRGVGMTIEFGAEIRGSGDTDKDVPPEVSALLQACGLTQTITAATSVAYAPNSLLDGALSCTIYFYNAGILHKITGCRGNVSLDLQAGKLGKYKFSMTGTYAEPTDQANVVPTFISTLPPNCSSMAFTLTGLGTNLVTDKLSIDLGNTVTPQKDISSVNGIRQYFISARDTKASFEPEAQALSAYNPWAAIVAGTTGAMSATLTGTVAAGNTITVAAPKSVITDVSYGEREKALTYSNPLSLLPNTGNDEFTLTFT